MGTEQIKSSQRKQIFCALTIRQNRSRQTLEQ